MRLGIFHTPRVNQGQIVLVSYTMVEGVVIRKTYDQGTRDVAYAISDGLEGDDGSEYDGAEPDNTDWEPISGAALNRRFDLNIAAVPNGQ